MYKSEQIVTLLRQIEVEIANGKDTFPLLSPSYTISHFSSAVLCTRARLPIPLPLMSEALNHT